MRRKRIDTTGKPWARYLRLSKAEAINDPTLTQDQRIELTNRKLDDHLVELTRWMDANRIPYSDDLIFRDPALSAWKRNVRRPNWDRMMIMAEAGDIAGIGIVAVDRFTRDVTTMEDLIKLAETTDVKIGGPRAGTIDLTTYEGIQRARGAAMQAANESLGTSFRIKERLNTKMINGKPMGGGRSFGWDNGGQVQRPEEVAIIREIANRHLGGESFESLADDLNARGITTTRGGRWAARNLSRMMSLPRYGGLIERDGEIIAMITNPDGSAQEPILDRDTYDALQSLLASRRRGRRPTGRFLLTGVLLCSTCQRPMNGATRRSMDDESGRRVYRCPPQAGGCGRTILAGPVEQEVDQHMIKLLSMPEHAEKMIAENAQLNEARNAQQAKLDGVDQQLIDLEVKLATGEIIKAAYDRARPVLMQRRSVLLAGLDELAPDVAMIDYDPEADWLDPDMTDEDKRQLMRRYHVKIEILPFNGARRFDPSRIRIE